MCRCYDVVRKSAASRQVEQVNKRVLGNMFTTLFAALPNRSLADAYTTIHFMFMYMSMVQLTVSGEARTLEESIVVD